MEPSAFSMPGLVWVRSRRRFFSRFGCRDLSVTAYEVDQRLATFLRKTLTVEHEPTFRAEIVVRDFIHDVVFHRIGRARGTTGFTHAILNPPYKKMSAGSEHRALLRAVGLETVNLYTAFVGLAVELMVDGGQVVASHSREASATACTTSPFEIGSSARRRLNTFTCSTAGRAHSTTTMSYKRT